MNTRHTLQVIWLLDLFDSLKCLESKNLNEVDTLARTAQDEYAIVRLLNLHVKHFAVWMPCVSLLAGRALIFVDTTIELGYEEWTILCNKKFIHNAIWRVKISLSTGNFHSGFHVNCCNRLVIHEAQHLLILRNPKPSHVCLVCKPVLRCADFIKKSVLTRLLVILH